MQGLESLLVVVLVAALTPMIVAALPGPGLPQVVILILAGVLIGPLIAIALARRGRTVPAGPDAVAAGLDGAGAGGVVGAARAAGEPSIAHEADGPDEHGAPTAEKWG